MKITDTIISIPPYISTTWDNVAALHMEDGKLIFSLKDGKTVVVDNLSRDTIDQIFIAHSTYLETHPTKLVKKDSGALEQFFSLPFKLKLGSPDGRSVLQHNPAYSGLPDIPEEMVNKISILSKIVSEEDIISMPPSEPNCNCIYCQIHRILQKTVLGKEIVTDNIEEEGEKIEEGDLHFEQWEIVLTQDNTYLLTNKLDRKEQYQVYLGNPIGCTCGKPHCEHIIAVLRS